MSLLAKDINITFADTTAESAVIKTEHIVSMILDTPVAMNTHILTVEGSKDGATDWRPIHVGGAAVTNTCDATVFDALDPTVLAFDYIRLVTNTPLAGIQTVVATVRAEVTHPRDRKEFMLA